MAKKANIKDVALVLQGGGARGAFTAGVLDVFMENGLLFPYVIGTSAGALNGVNYLSGDIGRSKRVCCEIMLDPKFCSLRNWFFRGSAFDFGYLFHEVPKTLLPFDSLAYNRSPVRFICVSTSYVDGKVAYFEKGVCPEFYKALASSASLPLISRPVRVEGTKYFDGGVVAPVPYKKPLEDGYGKLVMVMTRPKGYRRKKASKSSKFLGWLLYHGHRDFYESYKNQNAYYDDGYVAAENLEKKGKAFVIYPPEGIHVGRMDKDRDALEALYQAGYKAAEERLPELLEFLGVAHE